MLQVARRAEEARVRIKKLPTDEECQSTPSTPPSPEILALIDSWRKTHYNSDSPLCKLMKQRLRTAVLEVVKENAFNASSSSSSSSSATTAKSSMPMRKVNRHPLIPPAQNKKNPLPAGGTGTGLEPLMPEILHLGERIARLVCFHGKVYGRLYEVDGFIDFNL